MLLEQNVVDQVLQVGTGKTGGALGDDLQGHIRGQGLVFGVDLQDLLTALHVRQAHIDLTVKTAGAQQSLIQDVGTVGTVAVVGVQSIKEAEEEMNSFELAHFKKLYPNELDYVLEMMQTNDEIHTEITKSLAVGMLFGALGAYPIVLGDRRKKQKQDSVQPYEAADGAPKSVENADDTDKHLDA